MTAREHRRAARRIAVALVVVVFVPATYGVHLSASRTPDAAPLRIRILTPPQLSISAPAILIRTSDLRAHRIARGSVLITNTSRHTLTLRARTLRPDPRSTGLLRIRLTFGGIEVFDGLLDDLRAPTEPLPSVAGGRTISLEVRVMMPPDAPEDAAAERAYVDLHVDAVAPG